MRRTDVSYSAASHAAVRPAAGSDAAGSGAAGSGALALEPTGPRVPALRVETADGGRLLLRQGEQPLLLGRVEGGNQGVLTTRLPGYRSVVPPIDAGTTRRRPDWTHWFADALARCPHGPLNADRWLLREGSPPAYAWDGELVTDWPRARLDWGRDWNGIIPLRPLGEPDDGRVKAHRKQLRDGTAAPILLWWISGLDGWLLLDGHDRLVAALAEGVRRPAAVILARGLDQARQQELIARIDLVHERRREQQAEHGDSAREAAERVHADTVAAVVTEPARTAAWPVPGGRAAWDELARRHAAELAGE